jgi:hypothetical protein
MTEESRFSAILDWYLSPFYAEKHNGEQPKDETGKWAAGATVSAAKAVMEHAQVHEELRAHNFKTSEMKAKLQKAQEFWKDIGQAGVSHQDQKDLEEHQAKGKELQAKYQETRQALKPHAAVIEALARNLKK